MARADRPARDVHQEITDKIVAQLEAGTRPWVQPWSGKAAGEAGMALPRRVTGEAYRGINLLLLWCETAARGYKATTWMTFKQAQALGGCVRKGETGSFICYGAKFLKKEVDSTGKETIRAIPFLKGYTVFNLEQIDGLPENFGTAPAGVLEGLTEEHRLEAAEAFYGSLGADVRHGGARAYYLPSEDRVQMPPFAAFTDAVRYYDVLGHELVHWSGAQHRLNRNLKGRHGTEEYAGEELVAEMGAAFLAAHLGLSSEPRTDHADYIATWLRVLKNDKRFIFTAASAAQKAVDFLQELANPDQVVSEPAEETAEAV